MTKLIFSVAFAAALIASPAKAANALQLGQLVGTAEACGMTINDDAVVAYLSDADMLNEDDVANFEAGRIITNDKPDSTSCAVAKAAASKMVLVSE